MKLGNVSEPKLIPNRPIIPEFIKRKRKGDRRLIVIDFSQMELRVMCLYARDPLMSSILRDPKGDIHQKTADEFGVERNPAAKNLNFLLIYGGQEYMLSQELTFRGTPTDVHTAKAYIDRFAQVYQAIPVRRHLWVDEVKQRGFIYYITGRRRTFRNLNWENRRTEHKVETVAANNAVQGAAQDFLKAAIVRADPCCINPDRELPKRVVLPRLHSLWLRDTAKQVDRVRKKMLLSKTDWLLQVHDEMMIST